MITLPVVFSSQAQANAGIDSPWSIQSGEQSTACAIPLEFGGSGGGFSPEDLFAQALTNCFLATFKVYAHASKVNFKNIRVRSALTVDHGPQGRPVMSKCVLQIEVSGAERPDRVETLVSKALKSGFIINSVGTVIEHQLCFIDSDLNTELKA